MAKTIVVTDDLDGSGNAEAIEFAYGGISYTVDLAKKNRVAFEKALKPYIDAATKLNGGGRGSRGATAARKRTPAIDVADVRKWAANQGMTVAPRGRVARDVIDAYQAAHA
jgi:uncharacterized membrane protein